MKSTCLEVQRILCFDLIIKSNWLISVECVRQNIKEEKHPHQMRPDINSFIMNDKQTFEKFPVTIIINSVTSQDVFVMKHKFRCFFIVSDEGLFRLLDFIFLHVTDVLWWSAITSRYGRGASVL